MSALIRSKAYLVAAVILSQAARPDGDVEAVLDAFDTFDLTDAERNAVLDAVASCCYPAITSADLTAVIVCAVKKAYYLRGKNINA